MSYGRLTVLLVAVLITGGAAEGAQEFRPLAHDPSARATRPELGAIYVTQGESMPGASVVFEQDRDKLSARWLTALGDTYARSIYVWNPSGGFFSGSTVLRTLCTGTDETPSRWVDVVVRSEIHAPNEREVRDRWRRPMAVDCLSGEVRVFKWQEAVWKVAERERELVPTR